MSVWLFALHKVVQSVLPVRLGTPRPPILAERDNRLKQVRLSWQLFFFLLCAGYRRQLAGGGKSTEKRRTEHKKHPRLTSLHIMRF